MGTFAVQLEKFAAKTKEQASDLVGLVVIKMHERIDLRSPVGNPDLWTSEFKEVATELGWIGEGYVGGRFRANWQLGVDVRPAGTLEKIDKEGDDTRSAVIASLPGDGKNAGPIYYLTNNLPYAIPLEKGHSTQAPSGIVGLTVVEFQSVVAESNAQVQR